MSDINSHTFTGRIAHEPELKTTPSGISTCTISLAVEKGYGESKKVLYPSIVTWRGLAEFVSTLRKGTKIAVEGEYDERSWKTRNGEKRKAYEFVARAITAMEPKGTQSIIIQDTESVENIENDYLSDEGLPF